MEPKPFINTEDKLIIMHEKNPFSKIESFANITTDKTSMKIFLAVAKNRVRTINQLVNDTGLSPKDVFVSIDKLESGDFVARNPTPMSKRLKLGFNGQLFAEQLKNAYPDVKKFLGEESLIEPLK